MSDVERELGLDRDNLIELAMLLGSDYTEVRGNVARLCQVHPSLYTLQGGLKLLLPSREWLESGL